MPRHNLHLPRSWRSWGRAAKSEGSTRLFWPEIPKIMARDAVKTAGISRLHFSSYTVGGPKRGLGGGRPSLRAPSVDRVRTQIDDSRHASPRRLGFVLRELSTGASAFLDAVPQLRLA